MAVPSFDRFIDPLLRVLAAQPGEVRAADAHEASAAALGVTDEDKATLIPSGQPLYKNRVGWAHDRLKRAGLSEAVRRGVWRATDAGRALAARYPVALPTELVTKLARDYDDGDGGSGPPDGGGRSVESMERAEVRASPDERIDTALQEIRGSVAGELLELIGRQSPSFFERLVLDLLHKMGYGLSRHELQTVGGSGDGGIDGIISLDRLGLQKVYVQAKRWAGVVGGPIVRDFIGALTTRGADKGVLLTTSKFTPDAVATAERVRSGTIVLVDGRRLAELMIDHGVAVVSRPLHIPRIDGDYFDEG